MSLPMTWSYNTRSTLLAEEALRDIHFRDASISIFPAYNLYTLDGCIHLRPCAYFVHVHTCSSACLFAPPILPVHFARD
jgi:hypothetical protein